MKGVPDKTYFGEKPEGGGICYGEVRQVKDDDRKLELLKSRLDSFLIKQVAELNSGSVWSPFPLSIMTFLAIETLGRIIGDVAKAKQENPHDYTKALSTPVYQLIDKLLARKPTKTFYLAFEQLHGARSSSSVNKFSDVIHRYLRNTFMHGYQAKGVYLSHEADYPITIVESDGFLVINPFKFWERFVTVYEQEFKSILSNKNLTKRTNALIYFESLLK